MAVRVGLLHPCDSALADALWAAILFQIEIPAGSGTKREAHSDMSRPIGVTLLALGAGIAGLLEIWRALVFLGIAKWTFVGQEVSFKDPQWGQAIWALILAAIWIWIAEGFWNVRAYAWSFGIFISLFTLIFGFFALLGSATWESEGAPMLIAMLIFFYLNYPGVQKHFVQHEMDLMTPAQRAAFEQMQAAQAAAMAANAAAAQAPAPAAPPPAAPAAPAGPPPAPPTPPAGSGDTT